MKLAKRGRIDIYAARNFFSFAFSSPGAFSQLAEMLKPRNCQR
jgi:hypothetical protein